jgi:hypothetical protein
MNNLGLLLADQDPAVVRRWLERVAPASPAAPEFGAPVAMSKSGPASGATLCYGRSSEWRESGP